MAMTEVSDEHFQQLVSQAIDAIPKVYLKHLENVAFIVEDQPSEEQRQKLGLHCNQTLFGLYEGIPLPQRGGHAARLPDKITVFKEPLLAASSSSADLKNRIHNTIWHEVAHYYGLDHARIHRLDNK